MSTAGVPQVKADLKLDNIVTSAAWAVSISMARILLFLA